MDDRRRRLMERLLQTFSAEAGDLVRSVTEGLGELEKIGPGDERQTLIETVFRDVHSLKGAAHSVGQGEIGTIAGQMEDLLSAARRGKVLLSAAMIAVLYRGIDAVAVRVPGVSVMGKTEPMESVVEDLRAVLAKALDGGPPATATLPSDPAPQAAVETVAETVDETVDESAADAPAAGVTSSGAVPRRPSRARPAPPVQSAAPPFPPPPASTRAGASAGATPSATLSGSQTASGTQTNAGSETESGTRSDRTSRRSSRSGGGRVAGETVRIPAARLDALLRQGEGLLSSVILSRHVAHSVDELSLDLGGIMRTHDLIAPLLRKLRVQFGLMSKGSGDDSSTEAQMLAYLDKLHDQLGEVARRIGKSARTADEHHTTLRRLVDEHLYAIRRTRVVPFSRLLELYPAMVRETARKLGIQVELTITGGETEADRMLLDGLRDPLTHLLRNALDHAIEKPAERRALGKPERGTLTISVSLAPGRRIELVVADDGSGIVPDEVAAAAVKAGLIDADDADKLPADQKLALIFRSQVSTSRMITELSGRGLGLAIVRERIEDLGGVVTVTSEPGKGTSFRAILPSTLSTFHAIGLRMGKYSACIPATLVERSGRIRKTDVRTVENRATIDVEGTPVGMVWLADLLELDTAPDAGEWISYFVAGDADRRVAFSVDEIVEVREVLSKSLGPLMNRVRNVSGAAILGSGSVLPILSAADLVQSAVAKSPRSGIEAGGGDDAQQRRVLLVEDSVTSRLLLKTVLETSGYRVRTAADGLEAVSALEEEEFDVVVSDVEMPRMNGFSLTTRIREDSKLADLPVILVTTLESPRDRELGLEVGANAYIGKSGFDQDLLLESIERLI